MTDDNGYSFGKNYLVSRPNSRTQIQKSLKNRTREYKYAELANGNFEVRFLAKYAGPPQAVWTFREDGSLTKSGNLCFDLSNDFYIEFHSSPSEATGFKGLEVTVSQYRFVVCANLKNLNPKLYGKCV